MDIQQNRKQGEQQGTKNQPATLASYLTAHLCHKVHTHKHDRSISVDFGSASNLRHPYIKFDTVASFEALHPTSSRSPVL